jgi:hypothetical protein
MDHRNKCDTYSLPRLFNLGLERVHCGLVFLRVLHDGCREMSDICTDRKHAYIQGTYIQKYDMKADDIHTTDTDIPPPPNNHPLWHTNR